METVEHDGRSTAYRYVSDANEGPVMLYVHGSGGTHQIWSAQYVPRGPAHPAVAVDLSGHGASEDVETDVGPETLDAYVADVRAVTEATDAEVLVGNSLGGAVVLQAVLSDHVDPRAIVLAGTGAKLTVLDDLREDFSNDFESAVSFLHGDDMLFHDPSATLREQSITEMRAVGQSVTRRDFETCHRFDVRDRLDEIDVPTLAVCGECDRLTPPEYHRSLAAQIHDAEFETVPDAAHLAMAERPSEFNAVLAEYLASIQ